MSTKARKSRKSRKSKRLTIPKTAKIATRKSIPRKKQPSRANSAMTLTELQFLAKTRGIPFGGLSRTKLIKKINNYIY